MNHPTSGSTDSDPSALSIEQARDRIIKAMPLLSESESVSIHDALGRVTYSDVISPIDVPSFRASAMDGYALRSAEATQSLRVDGASLAGHPGKNTLLPLTCRRITTGAKVPDDADAVVQQENTSLNNNQLTIHTPVLPGTHVRQPGSDSQKNNILIKSRTRIGAAVVALLAAHGVTQVSVLRRLRVALFSTGDELIEAGESRQSGQIFDANRPLLRSLLSDSAVNTIDMGICPDSLNALTNVIDHASDHDVIVSSGGVSVGDADFVKDVLDNMGSVQLWKIAMKPGRPLTFGHAKHKTPFFGLPGNPVSSALTSVLFVKPAIEAMLGLSFLPTPPLLLPLQGSLSKLPGRVEFQRAIIQQCEEGNWVVSTTGAQDSHMLSSLNKANCLIELPIGSNGASDGEQVAVHPFSHFADGIF